MVKPHLKHEKMLWRKNYLVIGVDEVGRGAFAGPLVLGGVIFNPTASKKEIGKLLSIGINDSKKLTAERREELSKIIKKISLAYSTVGVSVTVINKHGISKATSMGVRKVISNIKNQKSKIQIKDQKYFVLIDAFYVKYIRGIGLKNQKAIVHGDEISLSIAAASIIAKVKRDNLMTKLSFKYPNYIWHENKGYGTRKHREAIQQFGKSSLHREMWVAKMVFSSSSD